LGDTIKYPSKGRGKSIVNNNIDTITTNEQRANILKKERKNKQKDLTNIELLKSEIDEANLVYLPRRPRNATFSGNYFDKGLSDGEKDISSSSELVEYVIIFD
jgi:hypothetical protein